MQSEKTIPVTSHYCPVERRDSLTIFSNKGVLKLCISALSWSSEIASCPPCIHPLPSVHMYSYFHFNFSRYFFFSFLLQTAVYMDGEISKRYSFKSLQSFLILLNLHLHIFTKILFRRLLFFFLNFLWTFTIYVKHFPHRAPSEMSYMCSTSGTVDFRAKRREFGDSGILTL